jgi:3'(2'), 5'-bisphosphate nucleotidase
MINLTKLTEIAIKASKEAGNEILKIYNSADFGVEVKGDDSPLTLADKAAHNKIVSFLTETQIPILSEEGKNIPFEERKNWEYFWMVDPLDGTKEFIKKNGEFTVNIALIHKGKSILGVVYAPVLNWLYFGNTEMGAKKIDENNQETTLIIPKEKKIETIVASRSHLSPETQEFIDQYPNTNVISMGSSLKFMLVAENKAQMYPRFAPTMEWDTAASQAVIESAGGEVIMYPEKTPLLYNRENMLNGWFLVN